MQMRSLLPVLAVLAVAACHPGDKQPPTKAQIDKTSPAHFITARYGEKVAARVIKSAEARGWKRSDRVFAFGSPGRPPLRTVQEFNHADGGGWMRVWQWEDGDDLNTVEGTVEYGRHSTGQSVVFNIQLYTPDGENAAAETTWSEVIYNNPGISPASIPMLPTRTGPGFMPAQETYCRVPAGLGDALVINCQSRNASRYFRAAFRNAWPIAAGGAAWACRRGPLVARIACGVDIAGGVFAGELLKQYVYPESQYEDCNREKLIKDWCDANGTKCNERTRADCNPPW